MSIFKELRLPSDASVVLRNSHENVSARHRMTSKEIIEITPDQHELQAFIAKLALARSVIIRSGHDIFTVEVKRETITPKGRIFLSEGGPDGSA